MGLGRQNAEFIESMIPYDLLDQAATYLAAKVDPEWVYGEDRLKQWAVNSMSVEEFQKLKKENL